MPLGFERLNERQQRPNALINFIKPLETADKNVAENFLQRIAAQCYPVMKKHHISVMSLEEYEPNSEFLGRNFNAGEVIQLVLKDRQGRWLSMKFVQMVMMHELAHCKQMNHSRFFWTVRNEYAKQMEDLWRERYQGEGMWGRGRGLQDGSFIHERAPDTSQIPEHLCGGSYRRRGRKRKRGQQDVGSKNEKISYAERQQRRIARKFGAHGEGSSIGEDELLRGALEARGGGKRYQGKPKVANSKRGRELRASAALARFEAAKQPQLDQYIKAEEDSETESEWEDGGLGGSDIIKDGQGRDLIKVCGDEAEEDQEGAGREMNELRRLGNHHVPPSNASNPTVKIKKEEEHENSETESEDEEPPRVASIPTRADQSETSLPLPFPETTALSKQGSSEDAAADAEDTSSNHLDSAPTKSTESLACPICSLENGSASPTCAACSHVLRPKLVPNSWKCGSESCRGSKYVNAGDVGRCGLCGAAKTNNTTSGSGHDRRPLGITGAEILRWD